MTVISLVQSNIIRSRSSIYKEKVLQKNKARRFLVVVLIFSIVIVLFFYILQANTITTKGYKIRDLKKQITELENENKILQVNISNLKSISALQSKIESFNMVKAENIDYVTLIPPNVVVAE